MISALLLLALTGAAPDLAKAQQLYERAKYEQALKAIGPECEKGNEYVSCERLRAFVLLALARELDARAAFHRMLAENPDATLGPDVAPKLQNLFNSAKRDVNDLQTLELEAIDTRAEPGNWVIKVVSPEGVDVKALKAFVAADDGGAYNAVDLKKEGDAWIGSIKAASTDKLRYYLVAILPTDVAVTDGTEKAPLMRSLPNSVGAGGGGQVGGNQGGDSNKPPSPFDSPGLGAVAKKDDKSLPTWAIWSIAGGAAVVVAIGVTLAIVLTREDAPGTVRAKITFRDEQQ